MRFCTDGEHAERAQEGSFVAVKANKRRFAFCAQARQAKITEENRCFTIVPRYIYYYTRTSTCVLLGAVPKQGSVA
jgi:hypothetical protein